MGDAPNILVVEDDPDSLTVMTAILQLAGYRVTAAASFEEAQAALTSELDLLVTDIRLGAYNGLQLIIRGRALNPDLRAIAVTGFTDPVVRRETETLDAIHLEKPFDPDRLHDEVAHAMACS